METNIHNVKAVLVSVKEHSTEGRPFRVMNIVVIGEDGRKDMIDLFTEPKGLGLQVFDDREAFLDAVSELSRKYRREAEEARR